VDGSISNSLTPHNAPTSFKIVKKPRKSQNTSSKKVDLGQYIVADPAICHGGVTFKGTRVFVSDVLADVERGLSWDFILERWGNGKITKAALSEAV
jgi:uncharacterized protein (DUF433 family)